MTYLLVALGAAVGAPARYLLDRWVQSWHRTVGPWGTYTVNVSGSAALGMLVGAGLAGTDVWWLVLGIGFCGAFTTYSTFAFETVRLAERRRLLPAAVNLVGSIGSGLAAATLGYLAVR